MTSKKKAPAKKATSPAANETLGKFLEAIRFAYPKDLTAPGLVLSQLPEGAYYVSVVRYAKAYGQDKHTVVAHQSASLREALKGAAERFLRHLHYNPIKELAENLEVRR